MNIKGFKDLENVHSKPSRVSLEHNGLSLNNFYGLKHILAEIKVPKELPDLDYFRSTNIRGNYRTWNVFDNPKPKGNPF